MEALSASTAFWEHLRSLCLDQFPCGVGSWNNSRIPPKRPPASHGIRPRQTTHSFHSGQLPPPQEETVDALKDFLQCAGSPWALPPDGNPFDQQLRELAVKSPETIRKSFLRSHFKSFRIVNKGVTEIDAGLLQFPNVEELILTANYISTINATNLPPGLKVLELCGNNVQSLKDLCTTPPVGLQHLGLGHNCQLGSSEDQYLTHTFWPNLVSLDLSYNNFTRLRRLLSKLLTLKKLRILVLQGNPFTLHSGYWGFTIDSLPKVSVLDDVIITPDEKHNFLDLASHPEVLTQDVKLTVLIGKIRGIPRPVGLEEVENTPDNSVITYSYYVTYEFAKGERKKVNLFSPFAMLNDGSFSLLAADGDTPEPFAGPDLQAETANVHSTARKPWAETVECDYRKEHFTRELVLLKAFLLEGTSVSVIEEKVVSWPVVPSPEENLTKKGKGKTEKGKAEADKKAKKEKEKEKKEKEKKEKEKKEKEKAQKGKAKDAGKAGNKKKKKAQSPEMRSDPPILKVLGTRHVGLEQLLAGELVVQTVCDFGVLITEPSSPSPPPKEKDNKKSLKKDKKAKPAAEISPKTSPPAKGKGRKKDSPDGADQASQPVPLTVEFQMQRIKWESVAQIFTNYKTSDG